MKIRGLVLGLLAAALACSASAGERPRRASSTEIRLNSTQIARGIHEVRHENFNANTRFSRHGYTARPGYSLACSPRPRVSYQPRSRSSFSVGLNLGTYPRCTSYPTYSPSCAPSVVNYTTYIPTVVTHTAVEPDIYGSRHFGAYHDGAVYSRSYDYRASDVVTVTNPIFETPQIRRTYTTTTYEPVRVETSTRAPDPKAPDGWSRLSLGRPGEAATMFAAAAEAEPDDATHLIGYAVALASQGDDEQADWAVREAIAADPATVTRIESSPALRLRASSLRAREATRGAEGLLLRAVFAELSGDRDGAITLLDGSEDEAAAALRGALTDGEQSGR